MQPTLSNTPARPVSSAPFWITGLIAGLLASGLNILLALVMGPLLGASAEFAPFQPLTILISSVVGALLATLVWVLLRRFVERPEGIFKGLALFALIGSFLLPLYIGNSLSPRFAGVTPEIQLTLAVMHIITAACVVTLLLRRARAH